MFEIGKMMEDKIKLCIHTGALSKHFRYLFQKAWSAVSRAKRGLNSYHLGVDPSDLSRHTRINILPKPEKNKSREPGTRLSTLVNDLVTQHLIQSKLLLTYSMQLDNHHHLNCPIILSSGQISNFPILQ